MAEKIKKIKKVRAKDAGELIHHYANQVNDFDTKGAYNYEGKKFYKNGTCFSKIIDINKKVVLIHPFGGGSGWGHSGYSSYSVRNAFSNDWTILRYDRSLHLLPDNLKDFSNNQLLEVILENVYETLIPIIELYNKEKHLIRDDKAFRDIYNREGLIEKCNDKISKLSKKFSISKKDILNHVFNRNLWVTVSWSGWTDTTKVNYKIDKSIKFYLNQSKWHTVEELDILEFKKWKSKYFNIKAIQSGTFYRQGRTYEQIWKDKEFKAEFEKNIEAGAKHFQVYQDTKRKREQEEELKKQQEKLSKWLQGDNVSMWNIPIHLRIKDNRIETTRNAIIPLEAGKSLFQLFNRIRQGSTDKVYNSERFKVGFYEFNKIEYIDGHWYVVVGCHNIRDTEIDLFINQYNLEEWKQMK